MNDIEVILKALQRERDDLHNQLMQVDRIIKRVKTGTYSDAPVIQPAAPQPKQLEVKPAKKPALPISSGAELKMQLIKVFDVLGVGVTLAQIQAELKSMTGKEIYIRDALKTMKKASLLRLVKDKTARRGFLWIKAEWLQDGQLQDRYKPEGFDLFYKPENLIYE